ncbi:MAG: hypothetical protein ACXABY_10390 [Candidatus Thorarchaeota archaeon]|jgi:hypothetical protein
MILILLLVAVGIGLLFILFALKLRKSGRPTGESDSVTVRIAGPVDQVRATGVLTKAIPLHLRRAKYINDEREK